LSDIDIRGSISSASICERVLLENGNVAAHTRTSDLPRALDGETFLVTQIRAAGLRHPFATKKSRWV
jgi:alpha-galactosidase/6-phospho-beta-glucosidase family protein